MILKVNVFLFSFFILVGCLEKKMLSENNNDDCITIMCVKPKEEYNRLNQIFQKKNLEKLGGVEYLEILKNIKCSEITIGYECFQRNTWIKKDELKTIFSKTNSNELCLRVNTLDDELRGDLLDEDSLYIQKSTVGIEALRLINSYYLGFYPCEIKYDRNQIDSLLFGK